MPSGVMAMAAFGISLQALAQAPSVPPSPSSPVVAPGIPLSGHYTLKGVMETGSELLLNGDGSFIWYLSQGALDLFADGTWVQTGGTVTLTSARNEKAPPPGFETLVLTIGPRGLVPPDGRGAYARDGDAPPIEDIPPEKPDNEG